MIQPPKPVPQPVIKRIALSDWMKGKQSALDDDRTATEGLKTTANVYFEQNGTVRPRPSLVLYGNQPIGTILGSVYAFVKLNGTTPENWEVSVQNVSGTTKAYARKDGGTWTVCNGFTFDNAAKCHFEQINNAVLISNGIDHLSYLDVDTLNVVPFTALATPSISSAVQTGLSGTNYTYNYRVSAIGNGETAASADAQVQVSLTRDQWSGGTSQYVTLTWGQVAGATRYNIYVGDTVGFEYYLDTVSDNGTGTMTYKDDSSLVTNVNRIAPNGDSTAGPKVTRCTNVLGQIFMVGDMDNPYRLWFGGTGDQALDFSAFDGGGWVEIDKGGREFPVVAKGFRDGHGNPVATVLLKGTSGRGKLIHAAMTSTSLGTTLITFATITEANGQDGTDAPDGVIYAQDSLWYPSRDGFKTTGTKAQIQNILSTGNFSQPILPDVKALNVQQMDSCVGIEFDGRLYWSLPIGSSTNNQIWVCDLNRNGIWAAPWYLDVDWMWLYDDNTGTTHFMALSNNKQYEFTYGQLTKDDQTGFAGEIQSGLIKFSPDGKEWGSVVDVTFVFERPQGTILMSISGRTEDIPLTTLASQPFTTNSSIIGWNEFGWNNTSYGWNAVVNTPTSIQSSREEVIIEIGEELKWMTWDVSWNTSGVDFQLADVIIQYVDVGVLDSS